MGGFLIVLGVLMILTPVVMSKDLENPDKDFLQSFSADQLILMRKMILVAFLFVAVGVALVVI